MPIAFQCDACGKRYQVKDALAGKRVKCAACGHALQVPLPPPAADDDDDEYELEPPLTRPGPTTPVFDSSAPAASAAKEPAAAGGSRKSKPPMDDDLQVAEDPHEAPPPEEPESATCPSCSGSIKPSAVICVKCGFNLKTGEKLAAAESKKGVLGKLLGGWRRPKE